MSTKRELLEKFFRNEPVERIPVGFWFHFLPDDCLYNGLDHPENMEKSYAGHKKYIEEFDPDMVKIMTDGLFSRPFETMPEIGSAADLYNLKPLDHDHPYFKASVKLAQTVRSYAGNDRMVFYNIFSPLFNLDKYLIDCGMLFTVYDLMQQDAEAVRYALDVLADDMCWLAECVLTEGTADGVYYSVNNYGRVIPMDRYAKNVTPSDVKVLDAANKFSNYQILHICGYHGAMNFLGSYRDYPVAAFNWAVHVEGMGLKEGREFFHNKPIIGGFDQAPEALINTGNKEDIQAFTEKIVNEMGNAGFIVGADCTVASTTSWDHLRWVREKVNEMCK